MAMVTPLDDLIATICPDLDKSTSKDVYIDIARELTSAEAMGTSYDLALCLRAAHEFTMDVTRPLGDGGRITSKTEGRTTVQYEFNATSKSISPLSLTQYGVRLKNLYKTRGLIAEVT